MRNPSHPPVIGIVGVCASGKSTLIRLLAQYPELTCRHIAQEHSYVPDMWQRLTNPDVLVYLEVAYPQTLQRRNLNWTEDEYEEQLFRLRHARAHADLVIDTNELTPAEVVANVLEFVQASHIK